MKNNHSKDRVLIINPPGTLQIGLQALLTSHLDFDVLVVSEVDSAINVIHSFNPALIILDQDISKKDLTSIIDRFKLTWPDIPCLLLVNDDQDRQYFAESDADLVLVKGIRGTSLIEKINVLLG